MTQSDADRPAGQDPDAREHGEPQRYEETCFFLFRLGDSLYGVPATSIDHVADPEEPLEVPTSPAIILGVLHLRGRIVAVVDIAELLALPASSAEAEDDVAIGRRLVVVESTGRTYGMFVDETLGIYDVRVDDVRQVGEETTGLFSGQFDHPNGVVTVIEPEAVLRRVIDRPATGEPAATA